MRSLEAEASESSPTKPLGASGATEQQARVRVALVAPLPPPAGGICRWTEGLLEFARLDSSVEIVVIDSSARYRSVWNLNFALRASGGAVHAVGLFAKYARMLLTQHFDVVHITTSGSLGMFRDLVFIAFARVLGLGTVLHMRGGRLPKAIKAANWEARLARITFRLAGSAIVLDSASLGAFKSLAPECPIALIENPAWKLAGESPGPESATQSSAIVFAGWVIPAKGVRELVLACREIEHMDFRLDLIGPVGQEFREELRALAEGKENGEWLNINGEAESEETLSRIHGSAFLVLPSYTEGCPNVVLEAMMLKKAVIATPVGAVPKLLNFEGAQPCGVCVPVRDAGALKGAIESLLRDPARARKLGARGRERVAMHFSPQVIYPQYRAIWRQWAAEKRK